MLLPSLLCDIYSIDDHKIMYIYPTLFTLNYIIIINNEIIILCVTVHVAYNYNLIMLESLTY